MIENKKNLGDNDCLMYRPFQSENERNIYIKRDHYSTSLDPRGYIPGKQAMCIFHVDFSKETDMTYQCMNTSSMEHPSCGIAKQVQHQLI